MLVRYVFNGECADIDGAAVVIDVLRAFSTATYATAWGAEHLLLVETLGEALHWAGSAPNGLAMKDGPPEVGFDLVNSPGHLRLADIAGKVIVQKTTAGTDCRSTFGRELTPRPELRACSSPWTARGSKAQRQC